MCFERRYRPSCDRNTILGDFFRSSRPPCSTIVPIFFHKKGVDTGPGAEAQIVSEVKPLTRLRA
jgi:hypothetical protein